jgi:Leucine-rich repeat (LRR) protein
MILSKEAKQYYDNKVKFDVEDDERLYHGLKVRSVSSDRCLDKYDISELETTRHDSITKIKREYFPYYVDLVYRHAVDLSEFTRLRHVTFDYLPDDIVIPPTITEVCLRTCTKNDLERLPTHLKSIEINLYNSLDAADFSRFEHLETLHIPTTVSAMSQTVTNFAGILLEDIYPNIQTYKAKADTIIPKSVIDLTNHSECDIPVGSLPNLRKLTCYSSDPLLESLENLTYLDVQWDAEEEIRWDTLRDIEYLDAYNCGSDYSFPDRLDHLKKLALHVEDGDSEFKLPQNMYCPALTEVALGSSNARDLDKIIAPELVKLEFELFDLDDHPGNMKHPKLETLKILCYHGVSSQFDLLDVEFDLPNLRTLNLVVHDTEEDNDDYAELLFNYRPIRKLVSCSDHYSDNVYYTLE